MQTRIHLDETHNTQVTAVVGALMSEHDVCLRALLAAANKAWKQFIYYQTYSLDHPGHIEQELNHLAGWIDGCLRVIDSYRWILRVHFHPDPKDEKLDAQQRGFVNQSNRLLTFMAKVVTDLRKDVENQDIQELMADYAEFIARQALLITGPVDGNTFVHPEAANWHHIHSATQRHMAQLWLAASRRTQTLAKKLASAK